MKRSAQFMCAQDDLVASLRRYLPSIGHIQVADAPGRHQPGTGTINYRVVFDEIEALGYEGHVGLEYRPLGTLDEALRWLPKEPRIQTEARALKLA